MTEFELIESCFFDWSQQDASLRVGQGDDALVWQDVSPLAVSVDTAVAGRHFPYDASPAQVAQRAFLPALSDLAAMGATPAFFTLALTLPKKLGVEWCQAFAKRLAELANDYGLVLAGGDTTSGTELVVTIQVHGRVQQPLLRSGAQVGDDVWVSGQLGLAAAALQHLLGNDKGSTPASWLQAYWQPEPRIQLGQKLTGLAHSAIDISDGLLADLNHLAKASHKTITIDSHCLPMDVSLQQALGDQALALALSGGDDYELAFTASHQQRADINALGQSLTLSLTRIGQVTAGNSQVFVQHQGKGLVVQRQGFDHFQEKGL